MSYCINPNCAKPQNPAYLLYCQNCGSQLLIQNRYKVTNILGEGGFAKTYEISDNGTAKVLKVLFLNQAKAVSLFQQEAQVLSRLNNPGIPKVEPDGYFTFFPRNSQEPLHCLVMEKIEGLNLGEWMHRRHQEPITEFLAMDWLQQITEILGDVHKQNYFHRDIKPANIMLRSGDNNHPISAGERGGEAGKLVLIDFGTAREITQTILGGRSNVTQIISAGYTPLEQINNQAVPQSDFFALGRTFVYLLTGTPPNELPLDSNTGYLLWRDRVRISPIFADLIDSLMENFPSQRPQSAAVILQRLQEIKHPTQGKSSAPVFSGTTAPVLFEYGGFWKRFYAYVIDTTIVTLSGAVPGVFLSNNAYHIMHTPSQILQGFLGAVFLTALGTVGSFLGVLVAAIMLLVRGYALTGKHGVILEVVLLGMGWKWIYFTLFESSPVQATPGKLFLGMMVMDFGGNRISWLRANWRYWSKTISGILLFFGFMMAGWNRKKRALHDILAGTLVGKKV